MIIGIPKEIKKDEHRVGLTPAGVSSFRKRGHTILVEKNAGLGSGYGAEEYAAAEAMLKRKVELSKNL